MSTSRTVREWRTELKNSMENGICIHSFESALIAEKFCKFMREQLFNIILRDKELYIDHNQVNHCAKIVNMAKGYELGYKEKEKNVY